jgi:ribonuclease P protein subunit POP4
MSELLSVNHRADIDADERAVRAASAAGMHAKLVKADFHGSIVTGAFRASRGTGLLIDAMEAVHASRNTSTIGLSGIVLEETENTFRQNSGCNAMTRHCPQVINQH